MNLFDLKQEVDAAIEHAAECGKSSESVLVSIQIDGPGEESSWSSELELHYDNDAQASGCVLVGEFSGSLQENTSQDMEISGVCLISAERKRQIEQEGWTTEHDHQHSNGELGRAAENYVRFACEPDVARDYQRKNGHIPGGWPWHYSWWKPSVDNSPASRIRDLVKAGALIAAEIDRLQRLAKKKPKGPENTSHIC